MRVGVLGGTFDPPHYGHLVLAEQARDQLALERVLWVPAADPPLKPDVVITPIEHRLAMLELALAEADNPAFAISSVDVERPGPHYTVDTLSLLADRQPEAQLFFLMGADSLRDLPRWHEPARLVRLARLVVMERPGVTYDLDRLEGVIPGLRESLIFLAAPLLDIAATDIRVRVAGGRTIRYLLPVGVEVYIREHELYQNRASLG
jgi:nicotinate-nucleotide adenylyltransferase